MSEHFPGRKLRYYLTIPGPCPYLEGQEERKVFVHLPPLEAINVNDQLSAIGFRRSQNIAYRPACPSCRACQSVRIPVHGYQFNRTDKRIVKRNARVTRHFREAEATREQYDLLQKYLKVRHPDGGMMDMTWPDLVAMVEDTLVRTHIIEYRLDGQLIGCVLVDALNDGLSLVYSFYDPDLMNRSLGRYVILDHIEQAQRAGYANVYLGYWVKGSPKMDYKARYKPLEALTDFGWTEIDPDLDASD
ncbi:arginyltransferase [Asticcacaulis sp. AND118]|uniref:arginyltransferase n=1 Tax=Asticcacaulis sp. AND118 TaxID=2840468 RepID=UPI001CFF8C8C|nr:arginyltransferase [Asticcacaulis sp. AND118]UDF02428.1 arginyltransferase [Asticcacaulis sp. AND118]